ncbi:MAG TPA: hypothetical protein VHO25_15225 [Polyangiaceae bacterium]|nr:hypothetical protein [Polyangiaceae bacterium]
MRSAPWLASVLLLSGASCGPSFEAVYEGNVRFEHCYRLDRDEKIASSHREYCWKQWVQAYTYGQPQDRVEYAKRRIRVLRGEPPPGLRRDHSSVLTEVAAADSAIPAADPPPSGVANEASVAKSASEELPGDGCAAHCRSALSQCRKGCQTAPKGCAPCEPDYNSCMRRCFE